MAEKELTVEFAHGCGIVYTLGENGLYVEFYASKVFSDSAWKDGQHVGVVYEKRGSRSSLDWATDPLDGERFVAGSVKWDGCVNFEVGEQGHVMMHACGPEDLKRISDVLMAIYERCRQILGDKADWGD